MPIESESSKDFEPDEFRLPSDLSAVEDQLRRLGAAHNPVLDRDDLMFRSGYAAAVAAMDSRPVASRSLAPLRWQVVSGAFATLSAALVIALWFSPANNGDSQFISRPVEDTPKLVANAQLLDRDQPEAASKEKANETSAVSNPINSAIQPHLRNRFQIGLSPTSAIAMRNRMLATLEEGDLPRPPGRRVSSRMRPEPLRAIRIRNSDLWEQL